MPKVPFLEEKSLVLILFIFVLLKLSMQRLKKLTFVQEGTACQPTYKCPTLLHLINIMHWLSHKMMFCDQGVWRRPEAPALLWAVVAAVKSCCFVQTQYQFSEFNSSSSIGVLSWSITTCAHRAKYGFSHAPPMWYGFVCGCQRVSMKSPFTLGTSSGLARTLLWVSSW